MASVEFIVPGVPVGKGRPRVCVRGNRAHAFTPAKTRAFEELVADAAALAMRAAGLVTVFGGPVRVRIVAGMPVPASWSKARRREALAGESFPVSKPDIDNIAKAIIDACNGVVIADDSRVQGILAEKIFSAEPYCRVTISER